MKNNNQISKKEVRDYLFSKGYLEWILLPHQIPIYNAIRKAMNDQLLKYVLNCSRRLGKSTILLLIAVEEALREPKRQIRFVSQTAKELKKSIFPTMDMILEHCPASMRPKFNQMDGCYTFHNKSQIHLSGVNGGHENDIRGSRSDLNIVDEAGMIDRLDYLYKSVLQPMTLTTNAITLIASTPALTPDHDFKSYCDEARYGGYYSEYTIYDNTSISKERIEQIKEDCGGDESTDWLREYMVKWVKDETLSIIPEWNCSYKQPVKPNNLFPYYHKYIAMDMGVRDKTAILYGYYAFDEAKMYIQSEDTINGNDMTTEMIAMLIKDKQQQLWNNQQVYKRVCDNNNLQMVNDMSIIHGIPFIATDKQTLDAMVNKVRMFISQGRLIVDPECKQLIGCLDDGIWNSKQSGKREFARTKTYGHQDALAALVYLIRNLDEQTNPIPPNLGMSPADYHIPNNPNQGMPSSVRTLNNLFNQRN